MATLDQGRASLHPDTILKDALTGGGSDYVEINGERKHVIGYMKDFLFGRNRRARRSGGFPAASAQAHACRARWRGPRTSRSRRADQ